MNQESLVHQAADEFSRGNYLAALKFYQKLSGALGEKFFYANIELCRKRLLTTVSKTTLAAMQLKEIRVATVMDEFTFHSYAPECQLLQLHPEMFVEQLTEFKPQLLFIESAWQGLDQLWKQKISSNGPEITACIEWCKQNGIPTLFWNKEDPVHFGTFLPIAKQVDYIFSTDIDCIARYKYHVGHHNVFLLPFAAQPKQHNPIELFERKDAFNFAGSYYLRYPERQRDFSALIDAVKVFRKVEIYDRNAETPHPHYIFPEQYQSMILGTLPFTEIDRAYKGYRYGINMNTIKQSQTMFARRVYELLASNTVVVSNFSRGMRLIFGDLVISSDNAVQIKERLLSVTNDEVTYRKFRLLGLRKIMSEHTYAHRFAYIFSKIFNQKLMINQPDVVLIAKVNSEEELLSIVAMFKNQSYKNKKLFIVSESFSSKINNSQFINFQNEDECIDELLTLPIDTLVGFIEANDYYGVNYLTDLVLASLYSKAEGFGKFSQYCQQDNQLKLISPNKQYHSVDNLSPRSALIRRTSITYEWLKANINTLPNANFRDLDLLAIDEFNYIKNGANLSDEVKSLVDDLHVINQGISFDSYFSNVAETLSPQVPNDAFDIKKIPQIDAKLLSTILSGNNWVNLNMDQGQLLIQSTLEPGKHCYIYANSAKSREELNLLLNSHFHFQCKYESQLNLRTVFEFQDKYGKKISHQMNAAGEKNALAIPTNCTQIRFGLRVEGPGLAKVNSLLLGNNPGRPTVIFGLTPNLVLTKQYPDYCDLYKYGFLHSRIRAYKKSDFLVDVFRISNNNISYREFEGIDVVTGDAEILDSTLAQGKIKHVLVHLLDENMWRVLQKYIDQIRVTIWVHGAEIQVWQRREFEFERMSVEEIERQKKLSDKRRKFWRSIILDLHPNIHFIFVSKYFLDEVTQDLACNIPADQVSIIHNFIDNNIFKYKEKSSEDRKKLLSIRPYASRKYANDLTVKAILELAKKSFFEEMEIALYGDGAMFDEITFPLHGFKNIKIEKKFLSQNEIAKIHRDYGIFITPTRMDAQGVSRDEAMLSGLVPITTNVAAIPEFVDDRCGMVAPPEDYVKIAELIEELIKNPEMFKKLSINASRRVSLQSGFNNTIAKEIAIINQSINRRTFRCI